MIFGITKLFAFLPFGNFLKGPLGKLLLGAGLVILAIIAFKIWLAVHDRAVIAEARAEWEQAQIAQLEEDRRKFEEALQEVRNNEAERLEEIRTERDLLDAQVQELIDRFRSGEIPGADNQSSLILREAIRALEETRRGRE